MWKWREEKDSEDIIIFVTRGEGSSMFHPIYNSKINLSMDKVRTRDLNSVFRWKAIDSVLCSGFFRGSICLQF
ncbi:hypothetical protein F0562_004523 [Nyssa sinensis]|uniref:Uncharacterized protein n=1 Tax=Nyssa sinensis TaxID=561372 RepID=A0A5J5C004_9ASTE|nr:hypothetical protein F0562_004523 [Nyssa sinensis]